MGFPFKRKKGSSASSTDGQSVSSVKLASDSNLRTQPTAPLPPSPAIPGRVSSDLTSQKTFQHAGKPPMPPTGPAVSSSSANPPLASLPSTSSAAPAAPAEATPEPPTAPPPKPKDPPKFVVSIDQVAQIGFVTCLLFQLLLFKLFSPKLLAAVLFIAAGFGIGMAISWLFNQNKKHKIEINNVLSEEIGMKGLQCLVKDLPSWVSLTEREKMEWMNKLLEEMWPFYDRAICQAIKDAVEPLLDQYKPPGIKKIFFKQLTFGDSPFRIEDIYVEPDTKGEVVMEVNVRWCGEANIQIAVDLPAGGEASRLCPKVSDISFVGTLRIAMRPLLDTIPGFGALMVSLKRPPIIKFDLNFGNALGGGMTANMVRNFIDPFLRDTLVGMLVWPARIVVPVDWLNPIVLEEVERMQLRSVGIMKITVDYCKDLNSYDMGGKSDPIVELYIDPLHRKSTTCKKSDLNPKYGETFYLLVQEPTDQYLRVVVSDIDFFNAKDMMTLKIWKIHEAINSKTFMGRSAIQVRSICEREGEEVASSYALGRGEWSDVNGPGKGEGTIHLTCVYRSFASIRLDECTNPNLKQGTVVVELESVKNLEIAEGLLKRAVNVAFFITVKVGKVEQRTPLYWTKDASLKLTWANHFTFYDVQVTQDITIKVYEKGSIANDQLGRLDEITVATVADSSDRGQAGLFIVDDRPMEPRAKSAPRSQLTEADKGNLYATLRFVPDF